jgi:hypothetical protein
MKKFFVISLVSLQILLILLGAFVIPYIAYESGHFYFAVILAILTTSLFSVAIIAMVKEISYNLKHNLIG